MAAYKRAFLSASSSTKRLPLSPLLTRNSSSTYVTFSEPADSSKEAYSQCAWRQDMPSKQPHLLSINECTLALVSSAEVAPT